MVTKSDGGISVALISAQIDDQRFLVNDSLKQYLTQALPETLLGWTYDLPGCFEQEIYIL